MQSLIFSNICNLCLQFFLVLSKIQIKSTMIQKQKLKLPCEVNIFIGTV